MRWRRAAERVMGAKYPSCESDFSEAGGEGEITRGVSGTWVGGMSAALIVKGGRAGDRISPDTGRLKGRISAIAESPERKMECLGDTMMGELI